MHRNYLLEVGGYVSVDVILPVWMSFKKIRSIKKKSCGKVLHILGIIMLGIKAMTYAPKRRKNRTLLHISGWFVTQIWYGFRPYLHSNVSGGLRKTFIYLCKSDISATQGHPRSLLLVPIESAYATFY